MRKIGVVVFLIVIAALVGSSVLAYQYVKPRAKEIAKTFSEMRAKAVTTAKTVTTTAATASVKPTRVTWEDGVSFESPHPLAPTKLPGFEKFQALCSEEPTFLSHEDTRMGICTVSFLARPGLVIDLDRAAGGMMEELEKSGFGGHKAAGVKSETRVMNDRAIQIDAKLADGTDGMIRAVVFKRERRLFMLQMMTLGDKPADAEQWRKMLESLQVGEYAKKPTIMRATGNEGLPPGMKKK